MLTVIVSFQYLRRHIWTPCPELQCSLEDCWQNHLISLIIECGISERHINQEKYYQKSWNFRLFLDLSVFCATSGISRTDFVLSIRYPRRLLRPFTFSQFKKFLPNDFILIWLIISAYSISWLLDLVKSIQLNNPKNTSMIKLMKRVIQGK